MRTIIIYKMVAIVLVSVATAAANADPAMHRYVVRVDKNLQLMQVEAQFSRNIGALAARDRNASRYLQNARLCESNEPLTRRGRRLVLPDGDATCIRYEVNLEQAAKAERRNATLASTNIIVSPASWFWRPTTTRDRNITVHFEIDDALSAILPWQPVSGQADTYALVPSPQVSTAPAMFGDFDYHEIRIPGAVLRISLLKSRHDYEPREIVQWIADTAKNVTLVYGQFPNPSPSIIVLPVGESRWSDSPVPFGRVVRDGGETIELFVNEAKPIDQFYDDWTATHEFSHLLLPYVSARQRWISEGFAQYYQNLLLARAGQYTEQRAWRKLYEGFERGRKTSPDMTPNEAAVGDRRASTMKIYWTGAALALLADVELRRRSDGKQSLDTVLRQLKRCCLPADERWSGTKLFTQLDSFLEKPVFMPLYRQHADTPGFPEVRPLLRRLGVAVGNDAIRLDQDAELAPLRRAMTGH